MGRGKAMMLFLLSVKQDNYASVVPGTTGLMASWNRTVGGIHTGCLIQLHHFTEKEGQSQRSCVTRPQSYNQMVMEPKPNAGLFP